MDMLPSHSLAVLSSDEYSVLGRFLASRAASAAPFEELHAASATLLPSAFTFAETELLLD